MRSTKHRSAWTVQARSVCRHACAARRVRLQAEVRTLEKLSERLKDGTRDIDSRVAHISQTATRIGDRLQVRGLQQDQGRHATAAGLLVDQQRTPGIPQGLHSSSSSSASRVCRQGGSALEEHD